MRQMITAILLIASVNAYIQSLYDFPALSGLAERIKNVQ
jgi:hypothetical protein